MTAQPQPENGDLQAAYSYDANMLKVFELLRKERPGASWGMAQHWWPGSLES
ncbi:hypothetical protein CE91St44_27190 [Oscillospiraceae bacterium]|nr:hypothetical protein CE91St44_27190 [Oscillospiraceae bacterium]